MVLRKPYAVLIKYFRVIHLIIGVFSLFLTYKIGKIIAFFNEYFSSDMILVQKGIVSNLFSITTFISIILILISTISILVLMAVKKKPIILYIYTIVIQTLTFILFIFTRANVKQLEVSAVDIRTLKLSSDLMVISLILQLICLILIFVRATGFNIKKFNFGEDLDELEITEKDREEFEVAYEVDFNTIKREITSGLLNLKYLYLENKKIINTFLGIVVTLFIVTFGYFYIKNNKTYPLGTVIRYDDYQIRVNNAYITNYDYRHNLIDDDHFYLLIKISGNKVNKNIVALNTGALELEVNEHKFYPISKEKLFLDLGVSYTGQKMISNSKDYLLVYELPKSFKTSKMMLNVYTTYDEYRFRIRPQKIDDNSSEQTYQLKQQIDFKDSIFNGIKLTLNNYDIKKSFQIDYSFKMSNSEFIDSSEFVTPTFTGNDNKVLLKLTGEIETEENTYLSGISLGTFIERYGKVSYEKDGKTYVVDIANVLPKKVTLKKTAYLEVNENIASANKVNLFFEIHSKKYSYELKKGENNEKN